MSLTSIESHPTALAEPPISGRPRPASALRSILFPSDLSPASDRAFEHARLLAEATGARLTMFHVVAGPSPRGDDVEDEVWRRAARAAHERLLRQSSTLRVEREVVLARDEDGAAGRAAR